jgi:general stress protein 26
MVTTTLDQRYSDPGATAVEWSRATDRLRTAGLSFITTVRPDGRPHATPLITVWHAGGLYFCTGPQERKAQNLAQNPRCALITGTDALREGLDIVVEGRAVRVTDESRLADLARAWEAKYGPDWHFDVADGAFHHGGGSAWVFEIVPDSAFSFGKEPYSQTRYRFGDR